MSERISLPGARVPLVGADGLITREWLMWFTGMFARVGGPVGFSNSELYGDAVALQSYDELLERISSLEAANRNLERAVQMMLTFGTAETQSAGLQTRVDTLEKLTVRGMTRLATTSGQVVVGNPAVPSTSSLDVAGQVNATEYRVSDTKTMGARETGYAAMTGAGDKASVYATGSVTLPQLAGRVKAMQDTLATHGLIGA